MVNTRAKMSRRRDGAAADPAFAGADDFGTACVIDYVLFGKAYDDASYCCSLPGTVITSRRLVLMCGVAILAVTAAGCGGGGSPSPQETWAESICKPIVTWKQQIQTVAKDVETDLKSPSATTVTSVKSSLTQAEQATKTLSSQLKAAGPPPGDSSGGSNASEVVNGVKESVNQSLATAKTAVKNLQNVSSLSEAVTKLGEIGSQLSSSIAATKSSIDQLKTMSGDMKKGFENASSCKELRGKS